MTSLENVDGDLLEEGTGSDDIDEYYSEDEIDEEEQSFSHILMISNGEKEAGSYNSAKDLLVE
jgi:hypothetical protein